MKTTQNIARLDRSLLQWVTGLRHPSIDVAMRTFTRAGDWQTWTLLLLSAFAGGEPYRSLAWTILPKLLGTFILCRAIKGISRRPRPSEAIQDFQTLLKNPDPYSFPSSHSACAWVVCASLGFQLGWGWPLWIGYASAISLSRIHVGAHYPLDVFFGTMIGLAIASFGF